MNPDLKAKWVADLRSGVHKQGHNTLHKGDYFCCFGRLCDILDPNAWDIDSVGDIRWCNSESNERYLERISSTNLIQLGISKEQAEFLMNRNDGRLNGRSNPNGEKWTFPQIADWIENNL